MYNLRYHAASLVAVFLALALGLVLGGLVVERGTLDRQRQALTQGLREDLERLSEENSTLSDQLALEREFAQQAADRASSGLLKGKRVLVITNDGRSDAARAASIAVERAGGSVATVFLRVEGLGLDDDATRGEIAQALGVDAGSNFEASLIASLAAEWSTAGERPVTGALSGIGLVELEDLAADEGVDAVVVVAANEGRADALAVAIGDEIAASPAAIPVIGAQATAVESDVALRMADQGLGAVDTVSTAAGRWALVALLSGTAEPRYFGAGEGAEDPFPPLPE